MLPPLPPLLMPLPLLVLQQPQQLAPRKLYVEYPIYEHKHY
jgi:hypothetical protein